MTHFTLYSRSYCHLCDDMLEQLQAYRAAHAELPAFTVQVLDVDADEALLALYDELVPVLVGQKEHQSAQQICHYFLDKTKLEAFLHG
ncbi:glutaredoxin family protein [Undibacterium sp. Jales W-56]|uniref:glutaredoxin family protein n=1 Tax=Undibacterium sp. Jales W-56 TaxID=2897325 RepID=UPI0021D3D02F|nr:glutaredoxin family protein [Undibacterium sp. Jales W-56]MCU6433646.1 glutaredoxin family protein [Undibacterium sp. Jales W-56]